MGLTIADCPLPNANLWDFDWEIGNGNWQSFAGFSEPDDY
jgi:hypothetical protein